MTTLTRDDFITPPEYGRPSRNYYEFNHCIPNVLCCEFMSSLSNYSKHTFNRWTYAFDLEAYYCYEIVPDFQYDDVVRPLVRFDVFGFLVLVRQAQRDIVLKMLYDQSGQCFGNVTFNPDTWAFEFKGETTIRVPWKLTC